MVKLGPGDGNSLLDLSVRALTQWLAAKESAGCAVLRQAVCGRSSIASVAAGPCGNLQAATRKREGGDV